MEDPTSKSKVQSFNKRAKLSFTIDKILRIIGFVIVGLLIFQIITLGVKILAKKPAERICWDESMCFNYCELAKQKICIVPPQEESLNLKETLILLITGRRNIIEILNKKQAYCGCNVEIQGETRQETFYRFYWQNK